MPSGLLHQINFNALPVEKNQTLGEKFNITLLSTAATIINYNATAFKSNKESEFILYGGIDYNKKSNNVKENDNENFLKKEFIKIELLNKILTYLGK